MVYKLRHTVRRGETYYYNRRVPKGVAEAFGCTLVRVNLGRDEDKAEKTASALSSKLDALWAADNVLPVDVQRLAHSLSPKSMDLAACLEQYLALRDICERPVRLAVAALLDICGNKDIAQYTRAEARQLVQALLEKGNKSATVRRRIQSLHAVFEFGFHEQEEDKRNPFARLNIPHEGKDASSRAVFSSEQLAALYIEALASGKDTRLVLPILGETGARLAEVVGLRWEDVCLGEAVMRITPHPLRRLKTRNSEREVPLIGAALEAMHMLQERAGKEAYVFPRWKKETGFVATHASNTLNKYLSKTYGDLTCHCFRHTMRDRLRDVGAPLELIDNIGGWSSVGGVGTRYGRGFNLERKREYLEQVKICQPTPIGM
ncbi:tyrosine-type recombinase/integrase [Pseudodonghicola flavimaris]|uniref:Tyrosine-type recombinase/integrase n=1 Tax=Pseudodonghicola flavimaris TaxID=3050036 RepID=A0ABT7EZZ3_9RHOB|nr:tyrosine-type recombinase/integrase [Pseudodonghicola flavimaris]MDK3017923.1 tyrosine-type recombinase/integrase [Pseudodonghicola flavimaris]